MCLKTQLYMTMVDFQLLTRLHISYHVVEDFDLVNADLDTLRKLVW